MEDEIKELTVAVRNLKSEVERINTVVIRDNIHGVEELRELVEEVRKLNQIVDRIDLAMIGDKASGTYGIVYRMDQYEKRVMKLEFAGILVALFVMLVLGERAWPLIVKLF